MKSYSILDHVPHGMMVLERSLRVRFWNVVLEQWTGFDRSDVVGHDIRERFAHFRKARYSRRLATLFEGGPPAVFSSQLHPHFLPAPLPSGRMRVLESVAVPVPRDGSTELDALVSIQDVSNLADAMEALREARRSAEELAATDPLTGVANRRQFMELAGKALALSKRHDHPCTVLMLDVDLFKETNDRFGHATGDTVLCMLVRVLRQTLRRSDVIARVGGDEFSVMLLGTDSKVGDITAERIRATVASESVAIGDRTHRVTVSIGCAGLRPTTDSLEELLHRADTALYEAKRQGRNRVVRL